MRNFVNNYFDNKTGEALRNTITKDWNSTSGHLKLLNIDDSSKYILEIGCGIGRLLKELSKTRDLCVGFDASKSMIIEGSQYCDEENIKLFHCSGDGSVQYSGPLFDYAFSFITFQHIPNSNAVYKYISEMHRLLKNNGQIKIQFLSKDEFPGKETWTYHDLGEIELLLIRLGFKDIKKETLNRWTFFHAIKDSSNR
jgi:ubiquinone/menaquinone biosynthesis C-methylase UbiE